MQMKWWLYVNVYIVASIYVYWVFLFRSSGRIWHTLWRKRVWFINIWGRMHVPLASYQTSTSQYKLHASNRMFYIVLFRKNVFFFQILLFCCQRSHVLPPKFPPNILDVFFGGRKLVLGPGLASHWLKDTFGVLQIKASWPPCADKWPATWHELQRQRSGGCWEDGLRGYISGIFYMLKWCTMFINVCLLVGFLLVKRHEFYTFGRSRHSFNS